MEKTYYTVEGENGQMVGLGSCTRIQARKAAKVLSECWNANVMVSVFCGTKYTGFFKVSR